MPPPRLRRLFARLVRTAPLLTALLFARAADAGDKVWNYTGPTANASAAGNWAGGVAPGAGDHVVFGSTTPTQACTWDLAVTVSSVDFLGTYASTVSLSTDLLVSGSVIAAGSANASLDLKGHQLSVGSSLTADGLTLGSSVVGSSVSFTGSAYGVASKSGGPLRFENAVFNKTAGSSVTVASGLIAQGFAVSGGTAVLSGVRVDLANDFYLNGYLDVRTSTIVLSGTIPQSMSGSGGAGISSLAALYLQNASTMTVPGLAVGVVVATRPASTVAFITGQPFSIQALTVQGGSALTRVNLVSNTPGTAAALNVASATIDLAYVRDLDASGGPQPTATHSINGGDTPNWNIVLGGGNPVWRYGGVNALASTAGNWVGGAAPTTGDFVTFGSTTPSSPCTWDISAQVSSISVVGAYAAPITLSVDLQTANGLRFAAPSASMDLGGHAVRLGGDLRVGAGVLSGVAGSSVSFEGSGPTNLISLVGGTVALPGLSIADAAGSSTTLQAPLVVAHDFAVRSGTVAAGAYRHEIGGSLTVTGGYFDARASTLSLSGAGAQSASFLSAGLVAPVGAFLAQSPSTTTFGPWTVGVFVDTTPSSNLVFATGASSFTVGSFTVEGQGLGTRIGLSGPGTLAAPPGTAVDYVSVSGLTASSATIVARFALDGGANSNWSITNLGGNVLTWKYGGGNPLASNPANWAGGVAPSTGDFVVFGATTPSAPCTWDLPVQLSSFSMHPPYASVVTLSTGLAVTEGLRLDSPGGTLDPAGQRVIDGGDWAVLPGAFAGGVAQSTVTFDGAFSSDLTSLGAGPLLFGRLEIGKDAGADAWILSDVIVTGAFETLGGNIDGGSHRFDVFGDVAIDGGAFDASLSTLVFSGSSPQATTGNGNGTVGSVAAVYVQNPSTTSLADLTADVFVATRPSATVAFLILGGAPTFGSFTVSGQSLGTRISLVSATPGTAAPLDVVGPSAIDYAYIKDVDASSGQALTAVHSIDGGDNTNWSISNVGGVSHVWRYAGGSPLASNAANWTSGAVPSAGDYVLFGSSTPSSPCTWDVTAAISSFSIAGAYASSVTLNADLTVNTGVRLDAPLATFNTQGHAVFDSGDWTAGATGVISTVAGSSVVFVGGGTSHLMSGVPAPLGFQSVVSSKTAGAAVVAQSDVTVEGDFIMLSGTFTARGVTLNLHHDLVSDGGYLDVSQTTVAVSGVLGAQQLTGNGAGAASNFRVLSIQTTSDVTLPGLSADIFIATRPSASILFATQTSPFTATALRVDGGGPSTRVRLAGSQAGVGAKLTVLSTATVADATVKDMDGSSGLPLVAADSIDLGDNTNWTFVNTGYSIQQALFQEADLSSATLKWYTTFPGGQSYLAQLSTGAFPNTFAGNQSSTTLNTTAAFFGLTPNTQYFGQVSTGALASFSQAGATVTAAALPAGPVLTGVFRSSVTATWGANGDPPLTRFDLLASTDSFATVTADSGTFSTTATASGLASNATYYFGVSATNSGGVVTMPGAFLTTVTAVSPPAVGTAASVSSAALTAFWSSGGDYPGTYFDVQISTNGYGTLVASTRTTALSSVFPSLTANTTYQLRVRALSNGGVTTAFVELSTAVTLMASPGAAATAFPAVGASSAAVAWTSGGNGAGTVYVADLSTDSFATLVFSSATLNLSAVFGTGGAGPALTPNLTYSARVSATAGGNHSAYVQLGSTATLPAPPGAAAASDVETASGTWSWGAGGNGAGTVFGVQLSTDAYSTFVQTASTAATTATFAGLTPNTTYQFRVQVLGVGGWTTPFSAAASSATMPSAPSAPAVTVFVSSAHAAWTDADPGRLRFVAEASSDSFGTVTAASSTANAFADLVGLAADTTYYLRVRAVGVSGASPASAAATGATLAFPPGSPSFVVTGATQTAVTWTSGGDPAGTLYRADLSTDSFVTVSQSSATAGFTATFAGLASDTTYYLRVGARNLDGTITAFAAGGATTTVVAPPTAQALFGVGASNVIASWGAGTNGPGTLYEAQVTTGVFPAYNLGVLTTALTYNFSTLSVDTTYSFQVRGVGRNGALTSFVSLGTTQTLLLIPALPAQPIVAVGVSSVAAAWTSGGNGAGTHYDADLSTDNFVTVSLTSVTASLGALFGTGGLGGALGANTTFYLRVRADGGTAQSLYLTLGSTVTTAAVPAALPPAAVGAASVTAAWGAGGNAAGTLYQADVSTDSFVSVNASSTTASLQAAFSGLTSNTSYAFRVRALGWRGPSAYAALPSTTTLPSPPGAPGQPIGTVGVSSVTVSWTSGGNSAGTVYAADVSTDGFVTLVVTSVTANLSAVFGTGGAGVLNPDTTYQFRVAASSGASMSAVTLLSSTATLAAAPTGAAVPTVSTGSLTFQWNSGGNPADAAYEIQLSTNAFATIKSTAAGSAPGSGTASFAGLIADTSYYARVRTIGRDGRTSAFAAAPLAWTNAAPPTMVSVVVGTVSATVTWTSTTNPPTTVYNAQLNIGGAATVVGSSVVIVSLQSNTSFFAEVQALGLNGSTAFAVSATTATTAATPASPTTLYSLGISSVSMTWYPGSNNNISLYETQVSTDGFATLVESTVTAAYDFNSGVDSATLTGLASNTSFYLRARTVQWNGQASGFLTAVGHVTTDVAMPVAGSVVSATSGSIVASWLSGGNSPATQYDLQASSDGFNTIFSSLRAAPLQAGVGGLQANTPYALRVRGVGLTSNVSGWVALPSTTTGLSGPGVPAQPFAPVGVSSAAVSWTAGGNGAGTLYEADVSTDSFLTLVVSSLTANLTTVFGTGGVGVLSPDTTYQFRVAASSGASFSAYVLLGATATLAAPPVGPGVTAVSTGGVAAAWSAGGDPADALYQVQLSTDAFATLVNSAAVQNATAAFGGLTPDSTYYLRVRAVGRDGRATAFIAAPSTVTLAAAPAAPVTAVTATSAALSWSASGDPATTVFDAQLSTDAFATLVQSTQATGTAATFSGLASDTTVYLRVRALGIDGPTAYATAAATATAAAVPGAPSASSLGISSVSVSWSAAGNAAGTLYAAQVSTDGFATVVQTSATANLSAVFSGLQANATYYSRVQAKQWNGGVSAFAAAAATTTPVAAPGSAPLVSVGSGSIVAAWASGGNQAATLYDAQLSTDAFATTNASVRLAGLQAGFGGLQSNTPYGLRVRAVGNDGTLTAFTALPSTTTALSSPGLPAAPLSSVGASSVTASWTAGGNGAGTVYRADVSSDSFATVIVSSLTANLSALFGAGGQGTLRPDTNLQFRVFATLGPALSAATPLGSTTTLPADPLAPAATASSSSTLTLSWTGNGNPADTLYQSALSTDAFATVSRSSAVAAAAASFALLAPDTTYFLRVRAAGRGGALGAYVLAPATATAAAAPTGAAAAPGLSSATLTWSSAGDPATTVYDAQLSTDAFATLVVSSQPRGTASVFSGLLPNTTYYARVRALGLLGPTPFSVAAAAATTPVAPSAPAAAALGVSSVSVSWASGGDPAGTLFLAAVSTDSFSTLVQTSATVSLSAVFSGLGPNTTYYLRVQAVGWSGAVSSAAAAGATTTPVAPPVSAPPLSVATGTVVAAWGSGGNAAGTLYDAQISTDAFATVDQTARTALLQAAFGGLLSNTAYALRVRAIGNDGSLTAFVALPSTTTALLPPGAAAVPFPSVGVSSVTAAWSTGGNGPGTVYRAQLSYDSFATVAASSDTQNLTAYFGTGGAGAPLSPDATYEARVFTVNGGNSSPFLVVGTTGTLAFDPGAPAVSASTITALTLSWTANGNPADTAYLARLSTDAFATVSRSSAVAATSAVFTGLLPDTTYYLQVRAASRAGVSGAYIAAPSTATAAAAPALPTAAFALTGATLTWSTAGDPPTTVFDAQLSTDAFATLSVSSQPRGGAAAFAGLTPNTTYFLRVRALGLLGATASTAAAPGATLPAAPTGASAAALSVSAASVSWSSGGDPAGTVYGAEISTDAFVTLVQTSATANLAASFAGLQANATYYLRVRADGWSGAYSAYSTAAATTTPVALPVSAPLVSVATGTVVAAWGSGGNAAGTVYDAQLSTDAFATVNQSARTPLLQSAFGGLLSNTAYALRVRAVGNDGTLTAFVALPSTTTALLPPAAAAVPFPAVGVSSLTVAWTSGGNGPGTVYRAQLSTDAFATVVVSSDTQNLGALFGTGGAGTLSVDTLYAARVLTVNGPNQSPLVPLGSTSTLAMAPTGTALVAVTSQTVTLGWSANGDRVPGTSFQVDSALDAGFLAPTRVTVSTNAATVSGLSMNTTYYFRVRAVSAAGAETPFDAAVTTATLPPAPGQPGAPVPTALGVSSITWTWTPAALAVGYRLYSDPGATILLNQQSSATFVESSLGPNASAYLVAVGVNGSGPGPNSPLGLGWTYAKPPAGSAAGAVFATSATVSWNLNGNPPMTGAEVQRSLDGVSYAVAAPTAAAVSFTDQNLLGCTTYYYRVRNFDGAGRATAFDSTVTFMTAASTPLAATALTAQPRTGFQVALSWSPSPSTDIVSYRLYTDAGTATVNFAAPYATLVSSAVGYTTPPLVSSAAYAFVLRATNHCGVEEKNVSTRAQSPALAAPTAVATAVSSPPGGRHISGNRVAVAASLSNGQLTSLSSVRFQYRASGAGAWLDIPAAVPATHPNPAFTAPYYTQWDVTALAPGAYDLRALAYDLSGSSDPAPSATTVSVDPVTPDLSENDIGGGHIRTDEAVYASIDNAVIAGGANGGDPLARLVLPAGALGTSTATLTLISDPDLTGISTGVAGAPGAGLYASVTLSNAQSQLSGGRTALLTLSYPDSNNDGIVDGTGLSASALRFYSYNTVSGSWVPDLTTAFDPAARTVTGGTPHFTLFGVFAPAAGTATLDAVRVYPVPYRPNGSNPDEGRPYAAGVAGTGIFFDNLPANARVQIFTVDGRLVVELDANGASSVQWDARNGAGRDVASGGYFAVVSAPGLRSVVKRLSIIR